MYVQPSDFQNKYQLHQGMYDQAKIQSYIDRYEKRYLIELLGPNLYDEMVADSISNVPQSPNFKFIFNPFHVNVSPSTTLISEGIEQMLLGFIYFEYVKDLINQMTPFGNVKPMSENSTVVSGNSTMMYNRYNEAVRTYRAIQMYISLNASTIGNGEALRCQVLTDGTGWTEDINDVPVTGGNGTGATFDVQFLSNGPTYTLFATIKEPGSGYYLNDVVTLQAVNNDATVRITAISGGDYSLFNGVTKQYAYWL